MNGAGKTTIIPQDMITESLIRIQINNNVDCKKYS